MPDCLAMLQRSICHTTDAPPHTPPSRAHSAVCSATAPSSLPTSAARAGTTGAYSPPPCAAEIKMVMTVPSAIPTGTPNKARLHTIFFIAASFSPQIPSTRLILPTYRRET